MFVQPGGKHTPDYVERLLEATGFPPYVIATHWDDFDKPLTEPGVPGGNPANVDPCASAWPPRAPIPSSCSSTTWRAMTSEVTVRWLGTNAWEVPAARRHRARRPLPLAHLHGCDETGRVQSRRRRSRSTRPLIDEHIGAADSILITHAHFDHIADVPYVAAKTGATVLGTETHLNLVRAMGTPAEQLSLVGGGELYQFEGYTVEVFRSSHGVTGKHKSLLFPGHPPGRDPAQPEVIKDLVEGGSLAYLVDFGGSRCTSTRCRRSTSARSRASGRRCCSCRAPTRTTPTTRSGCSRRSAARRT